MSYTIIRFPTAAKLGERPMATPVGMFTRLKRWLFGHQRKRTANSWKFNNERQKAIRDRNGAMV